MFFKNNFFHIFLIITSLLQFTISYIVLPFKYNTLSHPSNITETVNNLIDNQLIITLPIGTPKSYIDFYPSMNLYIYYLDQSSCLINSSSTYYLSNSDSFSFIKNSSACGEKFDKCSIGQDILYLYEDIYLKKTIEFSSFKFYYGKSKDNLGINSKEVCGRLGFQIENLPYHYYDYDNYNLVKVLKKNEKINSYSWYIHYYEKPYRKNDKEIYDGVIIFDIFKSDFFKDFPNIKNENNYNTVNVKDYSEILAWTFTFDEISYKINDTKIEANNREAGVAFETSFIYCPENYFLSIRLNFFDFYLQNNTCFFVEGKYAFIYCDKDKFKEKVIDFPALYFKSIELNKTFTLTGEDLFKEYNNKLLFMIVYKDYNYKFWTLGNVFMRKYKLFFDSDKKILGCFDVMDKKGENAFVVFFGKIKWYLFIAIGIAIGFFLGKKLRDKVRKLRANELEDKFEYLENKANEHNRDGISNYKKIKSDSQLYDYSSNNA